MLNDLNLSLPLHLHHKKTLYRFPRIGVFLKEFKRLGRLLHRRLLAPLLGLLASVMRLARAMLRRVFKRRVKHQVRGNALFTIYCSHSVQGTQTSLI